jgi:RNA-dependent RNA polymerase
LATGSRDYPNLAHLTDVIVFSSFGDRPQPDKMSGGDLDGDIYFAIWDPSLVPAFTHPAMDFTPPLPCPFDNILSNPGFRELMGLSSMTFNPKPNVVGIKQIADFFVNYMVTDNLGIIANAHLVWADQEPDGANSKECLELAHLHSTAVDFAKSGEAAIMRRELKVHSRPHFMENSHKTSYVSKKVLGQIYDKAKLSQYLLNDNGEILNRSGRCGSSSNGFDEILLIKGYENYVDETWYILDDYIEDLFRVATSFEVFDEAELVSGFVRKFSRKVSRNRSNNWSEDATNSLNLAVAQVQSKYRSIFECDTIPVVGEGAERDEAQLALKQKSAAWYYCAYTYTDESEYEPYLSFAWINAHHLLEIAKESYSPGHPI